MLPFINGIADSLGKGILHHKYIVVEKCVWVWGKGEILYAFNALVVQVWKKEVGVAVVQTYTFIYMIRQLVVCMLNVVYD